MKRTVAELHEQAKQCTLKKGDRVILADSNLPGVVKQDGGYGYFKIKLDGTGRRVIRHFTELAATAPAK